MGDIVSIYASLIRIGTTSVTVRVEAWVIRRNGRPPRVILIAVGYAAPPIARDAILALAFCSLGVA